MCNFYNTYIIYKCGPGPHNTSWRAAGWRSMMYNLLINLLSRRLIPFSLRIFINLECCMCFEICCRHLKSLSHKCVLWKWNVLARCNRGPLHRRYVSQVHKRKGVLWRECWIRLSIIRLYNDAMSASQLYILRSKLRWEYGHEWKVVMDMEVRGPCIF